MNTSESSHNASSEALEFALAALRLAELENLKLKQRLNDRITIERAKGILQARFGWTEEEAYLHLRRTSRQRRTLMRQIAMQVIESQPTLVEAHRAS